MENRASADAMRAAEFTHYQFMATLDRRTCARCGERDGEIFALKDMNQGENAPPLHPRCRCTIVATFDTPKSRSKPVGERSARETGDNRERAPADMTYRDWKAIYIDKSKTLETWQTEFVAKHETVAQSPLRQRGRAIIDRIAAGELPVAATNGKVATGNNGTEMHRRWQSKDGHEIIDQPTYNKLTRPFLSAGGIIIRGEEAARHLASSGATASYIVGANAAFIADDATVSDVLEEMYHAYQDRAKMFGEITDMAVVYKREINAQKYLLQVADKYKIPETELAVTRENLECYEKQLAKLLRVGGEDV